MGAGSISMWMKKISVNYKKYAAKNKKIEIWILKKTVGLGPVVLLAILFS